MEVNPAAKFLRVLPLPAAPAGIGLSLPFYPLVGLALALLLCLWVGAAGGLIEVASPVSLAVAAFPC